MYPPWVREMYPPNTPTITNFNNPTTVNNPTASSQRKQPPSIQQPLVNENSLPQSNSLWSTTTALASRLGSTTARPRLNNRESHLTQNRRATAQTNAAETMRPGGAPNTATHTKTWCRSQRVACGSFEDQTRFVFVSSPFFFKYACFPIGSRAGCAGQPNRRRGVVL